MTSDFAGYQKTNGGQKLQLTLGNFAKAQKSVQVVYGQAKNFRLAMFGFTNFQHPMGNLLSHMWS